MHRLGYVILCAGIAAALSWPRGGPEAATPESPSPAAVRVTDRAQALTPRDTEDLAANANWMEEQGGVRSVVLIVPSAETQTIQELGLERAQACSAQAGGEPCAAVAVSVADRQAIIATAPHRIPGLPPWKLKLILAFDVGPDIREGHIYEGVRTALWRMGDATLPDSVVVAKEAPFESVWFYALAAVGIVVGTVVRLAMWRHGFACGTVGVLTGGLLLAFAYVALDRMVLGAAGFVFLATIAMGFGWIWLFFALNLVLSAITGGGGGSGSSGGGGFGGGGGGFGGGGASGSW